jgi:hypothetical protein
LGFHLRDEFLGSADKLAFNLNKRDRINFILEQTWFTFRKASDVPSSMLLSTKKECRIDKQLEVYRLSSIMVGGSPSTTNTIYGLFRQAAKVP